MSRSSFFLVLEGLDGSGKSAITKRLHEVLSAALGVDRALATYEPRDDVQSGRDIRRVLAKQVQVSARTLALMFAANRSDHADKVITPFLESGSAGAERVVVCDRYYMSSLVYQARDGVTLEDVATYNNFARVPDLTLFMDAEVQVCYDRLGDRGGERELFETRLSETRAKYMQMMTYLRERGEVVEMVNANGSPDEVLANVVAALRVYAPAWLDAALVSHQLSDR